LLLIKKYDRKIQEQSLKQKKLMRSLQNLIKLKSQKEVYLFPKLNQPLEATLMPNQKHLLSIPIAHMSPPLRLFFKPKTLGEFEVFTSRKTKKPDEEMHEKYAKSPARLQVEGKHDEGVFLTDFLYVNIMAKTKMTI
jgi:hypothetical protein